MDDAAVVARLVGGDLRFLVEDDHARLRVPLGEGERGGKADDAAADDGDIRGLAHGAENTTPLARTIFTNRRSARRVGTRRRGRGSAPAASPTPPEHSPAPAATRPDRTRRSHERNLGYRSRTRASAADQPARTRAPGLKRICPSSTAWSSSPSSVRST